MRSAEKDGQREGLSPAEGPGRRMRAARNIAVVLVCLGMAILASEMFYRLDLGPQNAILLFVLAIFIVTILTDGYVYGLSAAVLGVVAFDFLITAPRIGFSFTIGFPITMTIMLLVALVTSSITARIRLMAKTATENNRQAELLYQINDRLLSADGMDAIAREANELIGRYLARASCIYWMQGGEVVRAETAHPHAVLGDAERGAFAGAALCERVAGLMAVRGAPEGDDWEEAGMALFVLRQAKSPCGVLALSTERELLTAWERRFVEMLAAQLAQALRVETLRRERQQALLAAEAEASRNKLLRLISHDLRTPLTSIMGASSVLSENSDRLDAADRSRLALDIHMDASWLLNMVQNILSTTRIQAGKAVVSQTMEVMEEVIANAVAGIRKRYVGCHIEVRAPEGLIMVPMDALLISQVITNLLENALRHAGKADPQVTIDLWQKDGFACVEIADDGAGLSDEALAGLFSLKPLSQDHGLEASRGFGMGLSLCKTVIEAHRGSIEGENGPRGGALFRFRLPMKREDGA